MPKLNYKCFVPGCRSSYGKCNEDERRHFFSPPKDETMLKKWKSSIPRKDKELTRSCSLCDLHFCPEFIIKSDKFLIKGETVELPRTNWKLTSDAFPHLYPGLPKYLSIKVAKRKDPALRKEPVRSVKNENGQILSAKQQNVPLMSGTKENEQIRATKMSKKIMLSECIPDEDYSRTFEKTTNPDLHKATQTEGQTLQEMKLGSEICRLKHQIQKLKKKCARASNGKLKVEAENKRLRRKCKMVANWDALAPKTQMIMEMFRRKETSKKNGVRYNTEFILEAMLLYQKSPMGYKHCAANGLLPLPTVSTLQKVYAKHLNAAKNAIQEAHVSSAVNNGELQDCEANLTSCLDQDAVNAILDQIAVFSNSDTNQQ